jgi:poly(hydroxyalkanoate) depolymerase family esterase
MFGKLWARAKAFFSKLFRRKPPEPGRFESGAQFAFRGLLATAPWILPRREYLVYVPRGHARWRRVPLLVLLHGCRQTPEEIAAASRITALADELGSLVLLPRQNPRANAWGCWNWFDSPTAHGWGETAIVVAQIRAVRRKYRINSKRVFVAGMSAGGGLASALGVRRPDVVAGVFVHSGVACGAASSAVAALGVLRNGADTDYIGIAREARARANPRALPVPLLVIHGGDDAVVAPVNATQLVRQYLALNGHPAAGAGSTVELPPADRTETANGPDARAATTSEWRVAGNLVARHIRVEGLGHAWSGGDGKYPYNDPQPPDATALFGAFVRGALQ